MSPLAKKAALYISSANKVLAKYLVLAQDNASSVIYGLNPSKAGLLAPEFMSQLKEALDKSLRTEGTRKEIPMRNPQNSMVYLQWPVAEGTLKITYVILSTKVTDLSVTLSERGLYGR